MGGKVVNLFVLVIAGVMIADMIGNAKGTKALFDGVGGIWKTGVNGMLGKSS